MVMADVTVLTDMWKEEEKRIKELLEKLGQQMKDHGVSHMTGNGTLNSSPHLNVIDLLPHTDPYNLVPFKTLAVVGTRG
jgi:hypothetical protein